MQEQIEVRVLENFENLILPDIIGNQDFKRIASLQMFTNPNLGEKCHCLSVGTIGTAKSTIAIELSKIMPGSGFTGKKVTPIGMAEMLISCSGSKLYVDEIDKIKKEAREMMLECMESQQVTIHKFGQHHNFPAKTIVCGFCNPSGYILNPDISILAQLKFKGELPFVSRFHFIVGMEELDSIYYPDLSSNYVKKIIENDKMRIDKLKETIIRVKQQHPVVGMSDSIARSIGNFVREIKESCPTKEIINPRLIYGLQSATKARARMNLRSAVTKEDWEYVRDMAYKIYV